jgi:hypothetical protein
MQKSQVGLNLRSGEDFLNLLPQYLIRQIKGVIHPVISHKTLTSCPSDLLWQQLEELLIISLRMLTLDHRLSLPKLLKVNGIKIEVKKQSCYLSVSAIMLN